MEKLSLLNEWLGRAIAWLTLAMVLVTAGIVLARYGFDSGSIAVQESVIYLHAMVFLLGAAFTLKRGGHVRVDILYQRLGERGRAWVDLLGTVLLLLPVAGFIVWVSWSYVSDSWGLLEGSREAGGLPGVFLLKSLIVAFAVLMILQGVAEIARAIRRLRGEPVGPRGGRAR